MFICREYRSNSSSTVGIPDVFRSTLIRPNINISQDISAHDAEDDDYMMTLNLIHPTQERKITAPM